jgi:transcriptional regulator with XRE-family HTH domain
MNFTALHVAQYLGVSKAYYSKIEKGQIIVPENILLKLSELYTSASIPLPENGKLIININSGSGSHSNSGHISSYLNNMNGDSVNCRLTDIERLLQLILQQLKQNAGNGAVTISQ